MKLDVLLDFLYYLAMSQQFLMHFIQYFLKW